MDWNFANLDQIFFRISDLYAIQQLASGKTEFIMQNPRPTDALLLFAATTGICYQKDKAPMYIPQGALVYLPKGCSYIWENSPALADEMQENMLFEFTLYPASLTVGEKGQLFPDLSGEERISLGSQIRILSTQHASLYKKLFSSLIDAFLHRKSSPLAVYCAAYQLFHTLSVNSRLQKKNTLDTKIIQTGIRYMEEHPCQRLNVTEVANMCGVSVSYFERIFKSYAGVPPIEYFNNLKIYHIKELLQDDKLTLDEIAEQMEYCDSSYLCRLFKKMTGMTPKEYKNLYFTQRKKAKSFTFSLSDYGKIKKH